MANVPDDFHLVLNFEIDIYLLFDACDLELIPSEPVKKKGYPLS